MHNPVKQNITNSTFSKVQQSVAKTNRAPTCNPRSKKENLSKSHAEIISYPRDTLRKSKENMSYSALETKTRPSKYNFKYISNYDEFMARKTKKEEEERRNRIERNMKQRQENWAALKDIKPVAKCSRLIKNKLTNCLQQLQEKRSVYDKQPKPFNTMAKIINIIHAHNRRYERLEAITMHKARLQRRRRMMEYCNKDNEYREISKNISKTPNPEIDECQNSLFSLEPTSELSEDNEEEEKCGNIDHPVKVNHNSRTSRVIENNTLDSQVLHKDSEIITYDADDIECEVDELKKVKNPLKLQNKTSTKIHNSCLDRIFDSEEDEENDSLEMKITPKYKLSENDSTCDIFGNDYLDGDHLPTFSFNALPSEELSLPSTPSEKPKCEILKKTYGISGNNKLYSENKEDNSLVNKVKISTASSNYKKRDSPRRVVISNNHQENKSRTMNTSKHSVESTEPSIGHHDFLKSIRDDIDKIAKKIKQLEFHEEHVNISDRQPCD